MMLRRGTRVLDRGDGGVQVGLRPGLILRGLSAEERAFVESLETMQSLPAAQERRWAHVLSMLRQADLLHNQPSSVEQLARIGHDVRPVQPTIGIHGLGPVGLAIALSLAYDGRPLRLVDPGAVSAAPAATYPVGTSASSRDRAATATVKASLPGAAVQVGDGDADLWVVVSHGAPALDFAYPLMAADIPHLFVTTDERGTQVGPLVIPGRSACGWCDGIGRSGHDAAWPVMTLQLTAPGAPVPCASADVTAMTAGFVAAACTAWHNATADEWMNVRWTLTTAQPPTSSPVLSRWSCGCGAAALVGDELAARRARYRPGVSEPPM